MAEPPTDLRIDWGVELWDKNDILIRHMKRGLDFCESIKEYFAELSSIETEYSQKLKRLHEKWFPAKKKEDDDIKFSHVEAFRHISDEVVVIANQHAEIGDKLNSDVVKDLKAYMKEFKSETQRLFSEGDRHKKELDGFRNQLDKAKDHYERAHRDTLKAQDLFRKTDQDVKAAKIDVEKCRTMMNARMSDEDKSKQEYAEQQQSFNKRQRDYFFQLMPVVHKGVQQAEEKRILRVQETLRRVHSCHQSVISIICKCIQNMASHTTSINPSYDLQMVVKKYESGEKPPGDVPFFDLSPSAQRAELSTSTVQGNGTISPGSSSTSLTQSAGPVRPARGQRTGSMKGNAEDFSDQPPAQQVRRLKGRIEDLEREVDKQKKACEGLIRMLDTFKSNEKGGDIHSTEKMLEETSKKYKIAQDELDKFNRYLAEAQVRLASASGGTVDINNSMTSTPRNIQSQISIGASPVSIASTPSHALPKDDFDDEFDEPPAFLSASPPESCRALYEYDGAQPGTLRMDKGEVLEVIERDPSGDQWTKVRRATTNEIGFVPTQYISIESTI